MMLNFILTVVGCLFGLWLLCRQVVIIYRRPIREKTACKVETFQSVELHVMAFLADKCVNLLLICFNLITQLIILNIQQTEYSGGKVEGSLSEERGSTRHLFPARMKKKFFQNLKL